MRTAVPSQRLSVQCVNSSLKAIREKNESVIRDVSRWLEAGETPDVFVDPRVLANRLLCTCYIGTENSSRDTQKRAKQLAEQIGADHLNINMDGLVNALQTLFTRITQKTPRFKVEGGSYRENQALQNIQARLRMVPQLPLRSDDAVGAEP